jgi:hypothetical protein
MAFQLEDLLHAGPIEITRKRAADRDLAVLDATVALLGRLRRAKIIVRGGAEPFDGRLGRKEPRNILARLRLIVLDDPDLVTPRLDDLQ